MRYTYIGKCKLPLKKIPRSKDFRYGYRVSQQGSDRGIWYEWTRNGRKYTVSIKVKRNKKALESGLRQVYIHYTISARRVKSWIRRKVAVIYRPELIK